MTPENIDIRDDDWIATVSADVEGRCSEGDLAYLHSNLDAWLATLLIMETRNKSVLASRDLTFAKIETQYQMADIIETIYLSAKADHLGQQAGTTRFLGAVQARLIEVRYLQSVQARRRHG